MPIQVKIINASQNVYLNLCTLVNADGSGIISVSAYAVDGISDPINVNTNVTIYFRWTGEFSTIVNGNITIGSGNSCSFNTYSGANIGENTSTLEFTSSVSPGSSGSQIYNYNNTTVGSFCPAC
jgi:hypothetical protein